MGYSKKWLQMTPEERSVKRKEYNDRYKQKYPERIAEQNKKYRASRKEELRINATMWQKEKCRSNKLKAIEYLGGKCTECQYSLCQAAMDFHHIDPTTKTMSLDAANLCRFSWD